MKISEVIEKLQAIQAEHGDIPVVVEAEAYQWNGEVPAQSVDLSIERFHDGQIIFEESRKYSEDLPKAVWV